MNDQFDELFQKLGITLPLAQSPTGNYLPYCRFGELVQLSGVTAANKDGSPVEGKLGCDLSIEQGYEAARQCGLQLVAALQTASNGDLSKVKSIMMVRGFVNATEDFESNPAVINGVSDLLIEVFGMEIGRHARTAIGCSTLPGRAAVEADLLAIISE